MSELPPPPGRRVPTSVLAISVGALVAAIVGNIYLGLEAAQYAVLPWLLALVPAFLLAYFRGWRGAAVAIEAAMVVIAVTEAVLMASGRAIYDGPLYAAVLLAYIGVAFAVGHLAELLHRQRMLAERNAFEVINLLDAEGNILHASPSVERVLGYRPEELIGRSGFEHVHPADRNEVEQVFAACLESPGEVMSADFRYRHKNGRWVVLEARGRSLLEDSRIRGVLVSSRDVTSRREAEESLARLAAAIETSRDGIAVVGPDGTFSYVNDAQARMYGFTGKDELLGRDWRALRPDEEIERYENEVLPTLSANGSWSGEAAGLRRDGSTFPHTVSLSRLEDGGMVMIDRDISQQKAFEEQLRKAQRMESIGRLAGGIAHDFNNVLTAVASYSAFLKEDLGDADPRYADVTAIEQASLRARGLTQQLLAFSRQQVLQPVVLDLRELIAETLTMLKRMIPENVVFEWQEEGGEQRIHADPTQVQQILMNLAINSGEAMPGGGVVRITSRDVELTADWTSGFPYPVEPGSYVELVVSDTGVGMSEELQANIFEPFFTTKESGTGLGLSSVYGIVKQSGGYIWVDSAPGEGTSFRICLPAAGEEAARTSRPDVARKTTGPVGERILVVEDDPMVRRVTERVLLRRGYVVAVAENSEEALELLEGGNSFDLLMTDCIMPGMSGIDLACRALEQRPEMLVLLTSGHTGYEFSFPEALGAEPAFLRKPFTPDQIIEKVASVLPQAVEEPADVAHSNRA